MAEGKPKKGAHKVRNLGRRKAQIRAYYDKVYAKRKLRHLLQNNGIPAARSWADKHNELVAFHRAAAELGVKV